MFNPFGLRVPDGVPSDVDPVDPVGLVGLTDGVVMGLRELTADEPAADEPIAVGAQLTPGVIGDDMGVVVDLVEPVGLAP